jgi:hypothetical protein
METYCPLPQPFSINKGTTRKWIDLLRNNNYKFDPSQLGFTDSDGVEYRNVEGVLCEVVRSPKTMGWDKLSTLFDGEQFFAPKSALKAAKMNGKFPEWKSFEIAAEVLEYYLDSKIE